MVEGEQSRLNLMFRAFRHRNYRLFFAGQIVSLVGTWMQSVAQSWLIYQLTGSATLLGLTSFFGQLPVFLLASIGGVVADAVDRRRILLATQTASMVFALVLAGLTFAGAIEVWHVFALAAGMGLANAFDIPARQSFVVEMVGREDLGNAIALNSSMFNGARIVGPAVAGLLVAAVGEAWCFLVNGVSYVGVIAGLLLIRLAPRDVAPARGSAFKRIGEGFGYVARTGPIRGLLLLLGLVSLVGMPYAVLMPIFADSILGGGAQGLGILMGASGVGALAAALTLAGRSSLRGLGRWVAYSSMSFGVCLVLFSLSRSFWLSAAILVPTGFSVMIQMASSNTLVQAMVPDELRGRVMSVYSMMFMGMAPLGAFFGGTIAERIGAPATIAIGAGGCILGAIVFLLRLPAMRPEAHRLLVAQESMGGIPTSKLTASGVR